MPALQMGEKEVERITALYALWIQDIGSQGARHLARRCMDLAFFIP